MAEPVAPRGRRSALVRFGHQVGWSFTARAVSALLQLAVIIMLARGLPPAEFAWVASAHVVMLAVVATNGFGLVRQISLRRARDHDDPLLPALFALRQSFTTASAGVWSLGCLVLWAVTHDAHYLALLPIAAWLVFEQTTSVWNGLSLVDGRSQDLMASYLYRRAVVVGLLAVGLALDWDLVLTWTAGLAMGALMAWLAGRSRQEAWARGLAPRRDKAAPVSLDLAYWWSSVGAEVRDLDVVLITALSAATGAAYALPARLVKPMNLVTVATASVAFAVVARRPSVSRRQLLLAATAGTVPVAVVAAALAACAGFVPDVVGEEYAAAVPVLRILCMAAVITGFGALLMTFLQTRTKSANRFTGYAILAFGVLQIGTAAGAAGVGGATAAAWAAVATQGVLVLLLLWRALQECGQPGAS